MRKLTKLFSTMLLAGCLITAISVEAFASTNKGHMKTDGTATKSVALSKESNGLNTVYSGKIKDMPKDLYDTLSQKATFQKFDPNMEVKVIAGYTTYTYENAPEKVKKEHEDNGKSLGKSPKSSDLIAVVTASSSNTPTQSTIAAASQTPYYVVGKGTDFYIAYDFINDIEYRAYIYSDYVGYGFITQGNPVVVAQVFLNHYGYGLDVDGWFGPMTHSAIESFQVNHGLSVDCIIGPNTWNALWNYY